MFLVLFIAHGIRKSTFPTYTLKAQILIPLQLQYYPERFALSRISCSAIGWQGGPVPMLKDKPVQS